MTKLTIITDDNSVYLDGEPMPTVDLSSVDPTIHAVQWDGVRGDIEYKTLRCEHCNGISRKPNESFSDLTPYQPIIDASIAAKQAAEEAQAAAVLEAQQVAIAQQAAHAALPNHVITE